MLTCDHIELAIILAHSILPLPNPPPRRISKSPLPRPPNPDREQDSVLTGPQAAELNGTALRIPGIRVHVFNPDRIVLVLARCPRSAQPTDRIAVAVCTPLGPIGVQSWSLTELPAFCAPRPPTNRADRNHARIATFCRHSGTSSTYGRKPRPVPIG